VAYALDQGSIELLHVAFSVVGFIVASLVGYLVHGHTSTLEEIKDSLEVLHNGRLENARRIARIEGYIQASQGGLKTGDSQ